MREIRLSGSMNWVFKKTTARGVKSGAVKNETGGK
jgi:hypothetical protein